MRFVSTLLAGSLAGTHAGSTQSSWDKARRGFFFVAIGPALVGDAHAFRATVRKVIDQSLALRPMAGTDVAALPGTLEWQREREWLSTGIPIPDEHRQILETVAVDLGIQAPPWASATS